MTPEEIKEAGDAAEGAIRMCCNEYHAHSAHEGCLEGSQRKGGDKRDVTILKLIEHIHRIEGAADKLQRRLKGELW